jgi:hypothetical protein
MKTNSCQYCGKEGLTWRKFKGAWKLFEAKPQKPHKCKQASDAWLLRNRPDLIEEREIPGFPDKD